MNFSDRFTWSMLTYLVSLSFVGPITFLSWLIAFAHNEGTINETVGIIGHYMFEVFRFPTHYLMRSTNAGEDFFFVGLLINVLINAAILTWLVFTIMIKKGTFEKFK